MWKLARHLLFLLEPELAHELVRRALTATPGFALGRPERAPRVVWGLELLNPVGLAAGFDKNADWLPILPRLGFGFAEVGTVTPLPQGGNPRPRLFRIPERRALFNRMGFNNLGAAIVADRVARSRARLPSGFRVGVNVGKNRDTPLADAARDYSAACAPFKGLADYIVANLSSPNTPGLRGLQALRPVAEICEEIRSRIDGWSPRPPLLLKLAPDLSIETLAELCEAAVRIGIDGWIATNTMPHRLSVASGELEGGLSGEPIRDASRAMLRELKARSALPVISVGGVDSPEEALWRFSAGAELVQIYTGWVYGGPGLPRRIATAVAPPEARA